MNYKLKQNPKEMQEGPKKGQNAKKHNLVQNSHQKLELVSFMLRQVTNKLDYEKFSEQLSQIGTIQSLKWTSCQQSSEATSAHKPRKMV